MVLSLVSPPTARSGADRCPGTVALHQAEDGGLARIRVPGGTLSRDALAALARWARELGNGRLELTARGNLQMRGLAPGAEVELSARLAECGLLPSPAHDRARNVLASTLSGRDGLGVLDVRPLVAELDRRLCASPELAALPGRFQFALDDGRGDVAGLRADVAVLALPGQRVAVLFGGRDSGLRLPVRAAVTGLLVAASAFLRRRADERVWRVSELPDGPMALVEDVSAALPEAETGPPVGVPERDPIGPVGRIEQTDGRVALAVSVPLGELTLARCEVLAAVAERELVLTPWRGVVVPDLPPPAIAPATRRLAGAGLVLDPTSPALGVSACIGRPGCALALADVRADASVAADRPAGTAVPPSASGEVQLPVHWSGCERRCGRPVGPVVDVVADADGYRVESDGECHYTGAELASVRAAATRARSRP
ncbi:precorrin-3B synthase [Pseudonocardia acaciae]|uniref:precorrin-3B synthase n=1 Tax=Pseudonocardia acaciae TaxID=551276 RepID=UPI000AC890F2|nr:precorrin-3B synthase [Pseudonocardia acaciae]